MSGLPSGATASLVPTSVVAGSSSTLTLNGGTAAPGSYTATVTGSEGTMTHTTTVAVIIVPPHVAISPTSGPANTSVSISGSGFAGGVTVKVSYKTGLSSPNPASVVLCTATTAADGSFTCTGAIPTPATAGGTGAHKIVAKQATPPAKAKTTFTLT